MERVVESAVLILKNVGQGLRPAGSRSVPVRAGPEASATGRPGGLPHIRIQMRTHD